MMKHNKLFVKICAMVLALLPAVLLPASAQTRITGKVSDEGGNPVVGAYVSVQGTQTATATDADGSFALTVPANAKALVVNMLGMLDATVALDGKAFYNIVMQEDANMLQETVVVGYGTMIKRELTSSVAQVGGEALTERASGFNILQNMAGKMAGVQVTSTSGRPGGSAFIRVRGIGSLQANNDPLYVVDGAIDVPSDMINSNDIETISVLKDAAATAMYGAKGANGVVLITTKSGKGESGTITYDGKMGVGLMTRKVNMMNADEYMQMQAMAYGYSGQNMPHLITPMENLFYYEKDAAGNYVYDDKGLLKASPIYDTDWWKETTRKAITQDHNLSFSQSKDGSSVYANLGFQDVQGLVMTTFSKRFSGTINASTKVNKWLDINGMVTLSQTSYNSADRETTMQQGAIRNINEMPPIVPVKYPDGTWGAKGDYPLSEVASNPVHQLEYDKDITKNTYFLGNMGLDFHIIDGLTLTVKGNYQVRNYKNTESIRAGLSDWSPADRGNQASIGNYTTYRWSNEDYFTYNKTFFDDRLKSNFVLGASWYYYLYEGNTVGAQMMPTYIYEYNNLGSGTKDTFPSSGYDKNTMNSYYFRMNQNWMGKYMLGVTARVDGSSNFGANRKYGFFPSVSAAWAISEEPFWDNMKETVNQLKLRVSYGEVGNSAIGNFRSQSQIGVGSMIMNDQRVSYSNVSTLGNSDLSWETSKQFDAGLDMALFGDRIQIITDFYLKRNVDLLFSEEIPRTSGYGSLMSNLGTLRNTGFELTLNTHPINTRNFAWDLDFIYNTNRTVVEKLYGTMSTHGGQVQEGEIYLRWGEKKLLGTWTTEEAAEAAVYGRSPGDYKLEDVNGNGEYDDGDTQYLGQATPKGEISVVNNFSWNGFNLMVDVGAAWGFKVRSYSQGLYVGQAIYTNSYADILDAAWTPNNQNTTLAQLRLPTDAFFGNGSMGDFTIQKGDFIRVRNIMLTYDLKRTLLKNFKGIKGMLIGVSAENAFLFTDYVGYDPECGWGASEGNVGYDWYSYPKPTTITGNIKISF